MNTYLKLFLLAIACLVFTDVTAQTNAREILDNKIAKTNKMLPIEAAKGVIYTQEYISGNSVCEVNEIDENYVSLDLLSKGKRIMKKTMLQEYEIDPNLISFAQLVLDCNMDIVYRYVSRQTGKSFSITLSNKELSRCLKY